METFRPLAERSLEELLWAVASARAEGLVVVRERDGARHGVWMHGGFVVGLHVAGRFDPLLDGLRRQGRLSQRGYRACVESLNDPGPRSGRLAMEVGGLSRHEVRDALKAQSRARMAALLEISLGGAHDARFEPCAVPAAEMSIRMPLGALLSAAGMPRERPPAARTAATDRQQARRALRHLAKRLHPDLHGHVSPEERRRLEQELAEATARFHGLAS